MQELPRCKAALLVRLTPIRQKELCKIDRLFFQCRNDGKHNIRCHHEYIYNIHEQPCSILSCKVEFQSHFSLADLLCALCSAKCSFHIYPNALMQGAHCGCCRGMWITVMRQPADVADTVAGRSIVFLMQTGWAFRMIPLACIRMLQPTCEDSGSRVTRVPVNAACKSLV